MTYLSTVLADNPLHYWRLADPEGNLANDIGSGAPFPLWVIQGNGHPPLGFSGPNLDGGSSVWDAANWLQAIAGLTFTPPITIEWILWTQGVDIDGTQRFPWGWGDTGSGPFHNEQGANGIYAMNFSNGAIVPGARPADRQWHHFAFTYAAAALAFTYYVDAVATVSGAITAVGAFTSKLTLGRRNAAGSQWVGALAEFAIYSAVLSGARITAHFNAIEQITRPPVSQQAGGIGGLSTNPLYTSLLDSILQAVKKTFATT